MWFLFGSSNWPTSTWGKQSLWSTFTACESRPLGPMILSQIRWAFCLCRTALYLYSYQDNWGKLEVRKVQREGVAGDCKPHGSVFFSCNGCETTSHKYLSAVAKIKEAGTYDLIEWPPLKDHSCWADGNQTLIRKAKHEMCNYPDKFVS